MCILCLTSEFSVIILTSNVGAPLLLDAAGEAEIPEEIQEAVMKQVRQHF